jgi:hypothetical protein
MYESRYPHSRCQTFRRNLQGGLRGGRMLISLLMLTQCAYSDPSESVILTVSQHLHSPPRAAAKCRPHSATVHSAIHSVAIHSATLMQGTPRDYHAGQHPRCSASCVLAPFVDVGARIEFWRVDVGHAELRLLQDADRVVGTNLFSVTDFYCLVYIFRTASAAPLRLRRLRPDLFQ